MAQARWLTGELWLVTTPKGTVTADHRGLQEVLAKAGPDTTQEREAAAQALTLVKLRQASAGAIVGPGREFHPDARKRLEESLRAQEEQKGWWDRFWQWLENLLGSRADEGQSADRLAGAWPVLKWLAILAAAVGLLVFIQALVRSLSGQRGAGEIAAGQRGSNRANRPSTAAELRQEARTLAAQGAYKEALRTAHLALLRHHDEIGLLHYRPTQTNREHVRALRRPHPILARSLQMLHDWLEVQLYSGRVPTEADFRHGESVIDQLWREGDAASKSGPPTTGGSSLASSS
jgi:hypothetical protein